MTISFQFHRRYKLGSFSFNSKRTNEYVDLIFLSFFISLPVDNDEYSKFRWFEWNKRYLWDA